MAAAAAAVVTAAAAAQSTWQPQHKCAVCELRAAPQGSCLCAAECLQAIGDNQLLGQGLTSVILQKDLL
jgi:hypothetical protein